jgi:PAS domain-containing protein
MKAKLDPAQLSGVIGSIYDCAVDPDLWPAALEEIADFVRGSSGVVMVLDTVENKTRFYTSWNVNPEVLRVYSERYHADNPLLAAFAPFDVDEPYNVPSAMDPRVWLESRVYREFGIEQGWLDNVGVYIMKTPTRLGSLSFPRGEEHGFSGPRELEILRLLSPHVRRAISITDLLDMRSLAGAAAEQALDGLSVPIALVDGAGRIVFANAAANALIAAGDAIRSDRDVLTVRDGAAASTLAAALAQTRRPEAEMGKTGIDVAIPHDDGRVGAAHVLPITGSKLRSALSSRATAAVFFAPTGCSSASSPGKPSARPQPRWELHQTRRARILRGSWARPGPSARSTSSG